MRDNHELLITRKVLLLVRNGSASTVGDILEAFGGPPKESHGEPWNTFTTKIGRSIEVLAEASLVKVGKGKNNRVLSRPSKKAMKMPISLSSKWPNIQSALGISLTELAQHNPYRSMTVAPLFAHPRELSPAEASDVFAIMPFQDSLRLVFDDCVKPAAAKLNLSVKRGDDFFTSHSIIQDIWAAINAAKIVVADCTGRNPNVFYELGLAHTIGKPVVLLTQETEDIPFDIRHIRYIEYESSSHGRKKCKKRLGRAFQSVLDGTFELEQLLLGGD